jgi:hypothetical protein
MWMVAPALRARPLFLMTRRGEFEMVKGLKPVRSTNRMAGRQRQGGAIDWFLLGMVAAVTLASIVPDLGRTGGLLHLDAVGDIGVFLIFFLHGMSLSTDSLKHGALRWKLHLMVQLSTFALFPLWWLLLNTLVGHFIPQDLLLGFFYLAVLPSTVSSSVAMTAMARGNVAAAVLNASLSTLLGVALTPLLASLVFSGAANGQAMDVGDTMLRVAQMLLLPVDDQGRPNRDHSAGSELVQRLSGRWPVEQAWPEPDGNDSRGRVPVFVPIPVADKTHCQGDELPD